MKDGKSPRAVTIEIKRSMIVREPSAAKLNQAQPGNLVALIRPEIPGATVLVEALIAASNMVKNFRIVDGLGPCYEFRGIATCRNDFVEIAPVGTLSKLR